MNRRWQDIEERESELLLFLMTLPDNSKFRWPGANGNPAGCSDRIMTFDPQRIHRSPAMCFFAYVNRVLLNRFIALEKKKWQEPISRRDTLRIVEYCGDEAAEGMTGQISAEKVSQLARSEPGGTGSIVCYVELNRFRAYIDRHNSELIPVLNALSRHPSPCEARAELGMTERFLNRGRRRLAELYRCYRSGEVPRRQRRVWQPHTECINQNLPFTFNSLAIRRVGGWMQRAGKAIRWLIRSTARTIGLPKLNQSYAIWWDFKSQLSSFR
jgi:hypothetical protein